MDPLVLEGMLPFFRENFGNPSTAHEVAGGIAKKAITDARESLANFINCRSSELIWTSGATESNNLAIIGFASTVPLGKRHMITQVTEHSAVLEPCLHLESLGWQVTYLPVNDAGSIDVIELGSAIRDETSLVSVMWGNNEIGTLHPIKQVAELCIGRSITFHCDAAQAAGKVQIDVDEVPVSMLTLSAHKFYGPKGVGALYVRDLGKRKPIHARVFGGGQERGLRAGTLNVPSIVGMGVACSLANENISLWQQHTERLRDRLESKLLEELDNVTVNGDRENRLSYITNLAFHGTDNEGLLGMLPELVASTGSACHVADFEPSHVLSALAKDPDPTECSLRFGVGKDNTMAEIDAAAMLVVNAVNHFRLNA